MSFRRSAVLWLLVVVLHPTLVSAQVVSYEAASLPEDDGWEIFQLYCDPTVWTEDGWLFHDVQMCEDADPPEGQVAAYDRSVADFMGADTFFVEWVVETTADRSEIPFGGGAALSAWSFGGVNYVFFIARDQAKLNRDNTLPIIFVDIDPGVPHHYRLALFGSALYVWYLDGELVDSGVPEGPYPSVNPNINLSAKARDLPNVTKWDYVRYGTIPADGSADFDSDDQVDAADLYFFQECLTTEAGGWAGCAWADMDGSGDVDCTDWALFVKAWSAPDSAPCLPTCGDCNPADFNHDGQVGPFDLATLLAAWGPCVDCEDCPPDLHGDCEVGPADLAMLLGSWG
ncbi:MAG: hypothetical protein IID41_06545 [Planctomycetes bacterium]|nr:hypothetical protein [Planctomycetota bacterium]